MRGRPITARHPPCMRYVWRYSPTLRRMDMQPVYPTWDATGPTRTRQVGRYTHEQAEARCGACGKTWWSSHPHVVARARQQRKEIS